MKRSAPTYDLLDEIDFTPADDELEEEVEYDEESEYEEEAEEIEEAAEYEEVEEEPVVRTRQRSAPKREGRLSAADPSHGSYSHNSFSSQPSATLDDDLASLLLDSSRKKRGRPRKQAERSDEKPRAGAVYSLAPPEPADRKMKPLPASVKGSRKKRSWKKYFVQKLCLAGIAAVFCWSVYGVSMEANLPFWRETFRSELARFAVALLDQMNSLIGMVSFG